jgi:hypothetical protein
MNRLNKTRFELGLSDQKKEGQNWGFLSVWWQAAARIK